MVEDQAEHLAHHSPHRRQQDIEEQADGGSSGFQMLQGGYFRVRRVLPGPRGGACCEAPDETVLQEVRGADVVVSRLDSGQHWVSQRKQLFEPSSFLREITLIPSRIDAATASALNTSPHLDISGRAEGKGAAVEGRKSVFILRLHSSGLVLFSFSKPGLSVSGGYLEGAG